MSGKAMGSVVCRALGATAVVLGAACGANVAAQSMASGCRPDDGDRAPQRIAWLKLLVSSSDTAWVSTRAALSVSSGAANKVALVTKTSTCQAATTALNQVRQEPNTVRQVWVYSLPNGYAVDDPGLAVTFPCRVFGLASKI
jgi:hypothetical protein